MEAKPRLYPEVPSAPLINDNYKLNKISAIELYLSGEVVIRETLFKKYKKPVKVCSVIDDCLIFVGVGSTAVSLGLVTTGIGSPIAVPVQGVGIITGVLGLVGKFAERRLNLKARKHDEIRMLAQAKLNTVSVIVARALEDGSISADEFRAIMGELTQYREMKEAIRAKTRKAVSKQYTDVEKNKLVQEALQNMLKKAK